MSFRWGWAMNGRYAEEAEMPGCPFSWWSGTQRERGVEEKYGRRGGGGITQQKRKEKKKKECFLRLYLRNVWKIRHYFKDKEYLTD